MRRQAVRSAIGGHHDLSRPAADRHGSAVVRARTSRHMRGTTMGRIIGFLYGLVAYLVFLGAFLYAIGFVTGLWVPKTIDTGPAGPAGQAFVIDILLMSLFSVQHSVMARPGFKRWWTQFVPASVERSTYVLFASLALVLLYWQWRPLPTIVWEIANPQKIGRA